MPCLAEQLVLTANLSIEPDEHVLYEGVLSKIPIGRLEGGETYDIEIPLTFMTCGRFELTCETFVLGSRCRVGQGQLWANVQ